MPKRGKNAAANNARSANIRRRKHRLRAGAGRYGPFVKVGRTYANLPKDLTVESVTLDQAVALLAPKLAKAGAGKTAVKKKATGKKAPARKRSQTKKARSPKAATPTAE